MTRTREAFYQPIVAYNVSGEYAMVKAAAANYLLLCIQYILSFYTSVYLRFPSRQYPKHIIVHSPGITAYIVAYNVSGEYAMVKAAAANGWIDEKISAIPETYHSP